MIVHILFHGRGLCGNIMWGRDHRWVHPSRHEKATCPRCKRSPTADGSVSDTDVPLAIRDYELKDPKPVVPLPPPKPELPPGEYEPNDEEHSRYIMWAKKLASWSGTSIYVIHIVPPVWPIADVKYALQLDDDPHRSRMRVDPDGNVWECEELT